MNINEFDLKKLGRNDLCPCGSNKKYKRCHMGRKDELLELFKKKVDGDLFEIGKKIVEISESESSKVKNLLEVFSENFLRDEKILVKIIDLKSYLKIENEYSLVEKKEKHKVGEEGAIFVNPVRTRMIDPNVLFLAFSRGVNASIVVHQLVHVLDMLKGSKLHPSIGAEKAREMGILSEFLEHPQEYGESLREVSNSLKIELDADDEIIAYLAEKKMLLNSELIYEGKREKIVLAIEKSLLFLKNNQDQIDSIIKSRKGYLGKTKDNKI